MTDWAEGWRRALSMAPGIRAAHKAQRGLPAPRLKRGAGSSRSAFGAERALFPRHKRSAEGWRRALGMAPGICAAHKARRGLPAPRLKRGAGSLRSALIKEEQAMSSGA